MTDPHSPPSTDSIGVVCVDVDGTLLRTDLLFETLLSKLKDRPLEVLVAIVSLVRGRSRLKEVLARDAQLEWNLIPFNEPVVTYLEKQYAAGKRIVLASASHRTVVDRLVTRLPFVEGILASSGDVNLKGRAKAEAIVAAYGEEGWEYIGDAGVDFAVWERASRVVCATSSGSFFKRVKQRFPDATLIPLQGVSASTLAHALRVHQWMKNVLLLVPVVLAHQWLNTSALLAVLAGAIAFSLCASGVYLLNDLLDLDADRAHPRKRNRPCASGALPLQSALGLVPFLTIAALGVALSVSWEFTVVLGVYIVLTTAYSLRLKALALVDIIMLAMLYTIRIIGGGVAANVHVSQWLLGLSMFLFLSLACVKRFSELLTLRERNQQLTKGRGYSVDDMEQVAAFGSSSAYISVLVLALYVSSREVVELYSEPKMIWLACPLLLYWVSRIWLLARRGLVHDDPLVFALTDKVTYAVGALAVIIFAAAKW